MSATSGGFVRVPSTFIAWNGDERPWPPPENWYRAADGRWWHPAHGPDDPPDTSVGNSLGIDDDPASAAGSADRAAGPDYRSRFPDPEADITTNEFLGRDRETLPDPPETSPDPPEQTAAESDEPDRGEPTLLATRHDEPDADPGSGDTRQTWMAAVVIGAVILGIAAFAQLRLGAGDADTVASSTATSLSTPTTVAVDTTVSPATADSSDSTDSTAADSTATGGDAGSESGVEARVSDFRQQMEQHGLSADELSDDQITTFASTYCVYAAGAEDQAAFNELRQVAITSSNSNLTPEQLNLTITSAVTVFCPDESDRLGIDYDSLTGAESSS